MPLDIKQHYVAFLDVLGFSEMVRHDTENDKHEYLGRLFKCHQQAPGLFAGHPDCSIVQFSDSVVIAKPYEADSFQWFCECVAKYQRMLLDVEILCRGGVAINNHYSNGNFTFSAGLIDAYRLESRTARYPRVVVSKDVLELACPGIKTPPRFLIKEDDGLYFVDYLGLTKSKRPKSLTASIDKIVRKLVDEEDSSVREKGRWLASYSDAVLRTSHASKRFTGKSVF